MSAPRRARSASPIVTDSAADIPEALAGGSSTSMSCPCACTSARRSYLDKVSLSLRRVLPASSRVEPRAPQDLAASARGLPARLYEFLASHYESVVYVDPDHVARSAVRTRRRRHRRHSACDTPARRSCRTIVDSANGLARPGARGRHAPPPKRAARRRRRSRTCERAAIATPSNGRAKTFGLPDHASTTRCAAAACPRPGSRPIADVLALLVPMLTVNFPDGRTQRSAASLFGRTNLYRRNVREAACVRRHHEGRASRRPLPPDRRSRQTRPTRRRKLLHEIEARLPAGARRGLLPIIDARHRARRARRPGLHRRRRPGTLIGFAPEAGVSEEVDGEDDGAEGDLDLARQPARINERL